MKLKQFFDGYEIQLDKRHGGPVIRTRIGLYVEDPHNIWLEGIEPIGYYELETDFGGNVMDNWCVIEKENT